MAVVHNGRAYSGCVRFILTFCYLFVYISTYAVTTTWTSDQTISSDTNVPGDLTIQANVTIKSGKTLTINGDVVINRNKTLTLEAGASLIIKNDFNVNANVTVNAAASSSIIVEGAMSTSYSLTLKSGTMLVVKNGVVIDAALTIEENATLNTIGDFVVKKNTTKIQGELKIQKGNLELDAVDGGIDFQLYGKVIVSDRIKRENEDKYDVLSNKGNFIMTSYKGKSVTLNYYGGELYVYNNFVQNDNAQNNGNDSGCNIINRQAGGTKVFIGGGYSIVDHTNKNHKYNIVSGGSSLGLDVYIIGKNGIPNIDGLPSNSSINDLDDLIAAYGVNSISALLPIELTSFTVSATEYGYTFNWVTASEVENDYFTLEFSEDGEKFIAIDYVSGAGTTSETTEYEYVWDAKPTAEILYFRLKQTDYNGEFTYSDILVYAPKKTHGATRTLYYGPLKLNVVDGQLQYIVE